MFEFNPTIDGKSIVCIIISFIRQNIHWALYVLFLILSGEDTKVNKTKSLLLRSLHSSGGGERQTIRTNKGDFEHCYVVCMDNRSNEESDGSRRCRSGLLGLGKAPPKRWHLSWDELMKKSEPHKILRRTVWVGGKPVQSPWGTSEEGGGNHGQRQVEPVM